MAVDAKETAPENVVPKPDSKASEPPPAATVPVPAAATAPVAKDPQVESLKWRIDVEDYVSEDGGSVAGSVLESIADGQDQDKKDDDITVLVNGQPKVIGRHVLSEGKGGSQDAPKQEPLLSERSKSVPSLGVRQQIATPPPAQPAQEISAGIPLGSAVSETEYEAAQTELSRLYTSLKEARARKADDPKELELKQQEVARLQGALKDARTALTKLDASRPKKAPLSQTRPSAKTPQPPSAMRRSVSEMQRPGPPHATSSPAGGSPSSIPPVSPASPAGFGSPNRFVHGGRPPTSASPLGRGGPYSPSPLAGSGVEAGYRKSVSFEMNSPQASPVNPAFRTGNMNGSPNVGPRTGGLVTGDSINSLSSLGSSQSSAMNWQGPPPPNQQNAMQSPVFTPLMSEIPENRSIYQSPGSSSPYRGPPTGSTINLAPEPGESSPHAHWRGGPSGMSGTGVGSQPNADKDDNSSVISQNINPLQSVASSDTGDYSSAPNTHTTMSPWRTASPNYNYYSQPPAPRSIASSSDIGENTSQSSGLPWKTPPPKSVTSEGTEMTISGRGSMSEPAKRNIGPVRNAARRLGNLPALASEGEMMIEYPGGSIQDNTDGMSQSGSEMSVQPGPNNALVVRPVGQEMVISSPAPSAPQGPPEGTVDLQVFSKLLQEMREEGENIQKLKQQSKLLHGWYSEAKTWADEKSLRAWEATAIADDAEEAAALKHKQLKDLDGKLVSIKDKLAGITMLEQENRVLKQRIQAMTSTKGPSLLLEQLKHGPRIDLSGGFVQSALKSQGSDLDALNKWVTEMQEEGGQVERLKKLNKLLQGWYADANSRAEDAITREKEEFMRAKEAEELAAAGDLLIMEMEGKYSEMRMKLAMRQMLDQENRELHQKIIALSSGKGSGIPVQKQQAMLLEAISKNLGFSRGRPVVACLVYKAIIHWSMIEVERLNTFDSVIEMMGQACKEDNWDLHAYWLSNAVHLHFLNTRGPSRLDATLAKSQMGTQIEKFYLMIRENVKGQLSNILNNLLQPSAIVTEDPSSDSFDVASVATGMTTTAHHKLVPTSGNVRRQMSNFWGNSIGVVRQFVDILRANFVPPFLVREFMTQLLCFIDGKLFNSIMMHSPWVPCSYTNGETMEAGLSDLDEWVGGVDEWLDNTLTATAISINSSLKENMRHIRETIVFLLDEHKQTRTLQQMQQMCPSLSMTQLAHICTWFEDDKDGNAGVDPAIIEQMWALMTEDSPFLIKEDKSCPFQADEVSRTMREFALDDVEPPADLRKEGAFYFLRPAPPPAPSTDPRRRMTM